MSNIYQHKEEYISIASEALYHLENADSILEKAQHWGIADIFGGGLIVTYVKHRKINQAVEEIKIAQRLLRKLTRLMNQSHAISSIKVNNDSFLNFIDYFSTGIGDMVIQRNINEMRNQVLDTIAELNGILDGLEDLGGLDDWDY